MEKTNWLKEKRGGNLITETWQFGKRVKAQTHWACGRPMAKYKGAYPEGFIQRVEKVVGLKNKKVLSLFSGSSTVGDTVDIKAETNPTYVADCRVKLPIKSKSYDVVIADPPYDSQNITYSNKLYKEDVVRPYSFVDEAVRVLRGGAIC